MCLIKLVGLYFTVLPPPLKIITLQTLQAAVKLLDYGVASVKYLHTADSLARSMFLLSLSIHWLDTSCTPHGAMLQAKNFHGLHTSNQQQQINKNSNIYNVMFTKFL